LRIRDRDLESSSLEFLNLGCGYRWHPDWVNVDFISASPSVQSQDLRQGIPYPDDTFDVVYHSHVLEHFSQHDARNLLLECHRVLRQGGIIRVVVPDFEEVARLYLDALEKAANGAPGWRDNYDWIVLEMFDQAVRELPGGSWYEYLRQSPIPNWDFVFKRVGPEAENALKAAQGETISNVSWLASIVVNLGFILRNPRKVLQNKLAKIVLSREDYRALQLGRFRRQGEVHQWMYDYYSLGRVLKETGFSDPRRCRPMESQIPNWMQYKLDCEPDGTPYRPNSLYMEALKT